MTTLCIRLVLAPALVARMPHTPALSLQGAAFLDIGDTTLNAILGNRPTLLAPSPIFGHSAISIRRPQSKFNV
jgi:hypothetical protein